MLPLPALLLLMPLLPLLPPENQCCATSKGIENMTSICVGPTPAITPSRGTIGEGRGSTSPLRNRGMSDVDSDDDDDDDDDEEEEEEEDFVSFVVGFPDAAPNVDVDVVVAVAAVVVDVDDVSNMESGTSPWCKFGVGGSIMMSIRRLGDVAPFETGNVTRFLWGLERIGSIHAWFARYGVTVRSG